MQYFQWFLLILNTIFLIGIAGSVAKILKYLQGTEDEKDDWAGIIRNRRVLDSQTRPPNYADPSQINSMDDRTQNWDGIPRTSRNWDGIPNQED